MKLTDLELDDLDEYSSLDLRIDYSAYQTQVITFHLENETYALPVKKIVELIGFTHISELPNMPPFVKGVIHLRGEVFPVIDLRLKFGLPEKPYTRYTIMIITQMGEKRTGVIVDSVSDVVYLSDESIQATPDMPTQVNTAYIKGIARHDDELIILLNIDSVLSKDELDLLPESEKAEG